MTTPKRMGSAFEYRVAHTFQHFGYSWDRSRSSLGIDLRIWKTGRLRYLINVKKTSTLRPIYLPKSEVRRLRASAKEMGARGLVCFGFRRTPILAVPLEDIQKLRKTRLCYKLAPEDGKPLKEMLARER
jgi:Holliday junction resolvase